MNLQSLDTETKDPLVGIINELITPMSKAGMIPVLAYNSKGGIPRILVSRENGALVTKLNTLTVVFDSSAEDGVDKTIVESIIQSFRYTLENSGTDIVNSVEGNWSNAALYYVTVRSEQTSLK